MSKPDWRDEVLDCFNKSRRDVFNELFRYDTTHAVPFRLRELVLDIRSAEASERYSKAIIRLTIALVALTLALVGLTIVIVVKA